jgi:hypothetical protein
MGADKNRQITPPSRFPRSHRARRGRFDFPGASGRSNPTSCGHRPTAEPGQAPPAAARQAPSGRVRPCSPRSRDPRCRHPRPPWRPPPRKATATVHRDAATSPRCALAKTLHRLSWQVTLLHSGRKSCPSSPIDLEMLEGPAEPARAARRVGRWCGQTFHGPNRSPVEDRRRQ